MVLGTAGYMAPEQIRGQAGRQRADIFALGAVLYEMLAGRRAFQRDTAAETMTAILKEDPPELSLSRSDLPPALDGIVRHCLERQPAERFQSARDLVFNLQAASLATGSSPAPAVAAAAQRIAAKDRTARGRGLDAGHGACRRVRGRHFHVARAAAVRSRAGRRAFSGVSAGQDYVGLPARRLRRIQQRHDFSRRHDARVRRRGRDRQGPAVVAAHRQLHGTCASRHRGRGVSILVAR